MNTRYLIANIHNPMQALVAASNEPSWERQHLTAWTPYDRTQAGAIVRAVVAWGEYADAYATKQEEMIGTDGYVGAAWAQWGQALLDLLNADTGGLDCGTVDKIIRHIALYNGIDLDGGDK